MNTANGIYPPHQPSLNPSLDQNGLHNSFGHGFGGPGVNPNGFDVSQFQNQQRFGDGIPNNTSPSIHQSPFQVPSVIPAKRTRDDQVGASPHPPPPPPPTSLGQSRSQTPQQAAFNQFGGQGAGPQLSTPTPFQQHLQQSNHATPSPNPSQQQFRPPSSQPHMSPPPNFPGQGGHPGAFPPHMANPMNRMGTPQNPSQFGVHPGGHGGMPGAGPPTGGQFPNMRGAMQGNMGPQPNELLQKQYQANLMRQQQMHRGMGQMPPGGQVNGMTPQQRAALSGGMNPNVPGRPGFPPNAEHTQQQISGFIMQLEKFTQSRGQVLDPNPTVCGRRVHYWQIFFQYLKFKPNQDPQGWAKIASTFGITSDQLPIAVQELRSLFDRNLSAFTMQYMATMQQRQRSMQQGRMPGQASPPNDHVPRPPMPPSFPGHATQTSAPQAGSPGLGNSRRSVPSVANDVGSSTPDKISSTVDHSSSPHQFPQGSPVQLKVSPQEDLDNKVKVDGVEHLDRIPNEEEFNKPFDPEYKPKRFELSTHGGINLDALVENSAVVHEMNTYQRYEELGPVDLHALTMGLQSGFHEEVKYALDRLAILSQRPLILSECEDLIDTLVELGQGQLTKLYEGVDSGPDWQSLPLYENLSACCREELSAFRNMSSFGDKEYEQQHRVDTLITITTILRNVSFPVSERSDHERENEKNRKIISTSEMQSLWTRIIKLLAVRPSPLLPKADTLDIMKDLVVLLSNVCEGLIITSEDDARALLAFLLSFAPQPAASNRTSTLCFAGYEPLKHQYLPNALDSLAKILARDDPNRGFFKMIFHNDLASTNKDAQPLITQAFALAIAPIPESAFNGPSMGVPLRLVDKRKAFVSQGMLVLDILSTMLPPSNPNTAVKSKAGCLQRTWLESSDGWVSRLLHLVIHMGMHDAQHPPERHPVTHAAIDSGRSFSSITQRALSMVRRLIEAADKVDIENGRERTDLTSSKVLGLVPLEDMNFTAMLMQRFDAETLRCLSALMRLAP